MTQTASKAPIGIQEVLDREAIRDVIYRYCRAIDRQDAELLRSCYHEDAIEDHGGIFYGPLDEWVRQTINHDLSIFTATSHMVTNTAIVLEGDEAYVETYVLASHESRDDGSGAELMWLAGRYIDRFVRRDGEWRILRRALMVDWTHTEPRVIAFGKGAPEGKPVPDVVLRRGLHSHEDPAYLESARALLA
jgi:ketosteroid isomerase-like protein